MDKDLVPLSNSEFINFIKTTYGYFSNKERILLNSSGLIDIVRMIGCLPLDKKNFNVTNEYVRKLSTMVLSKVSQQLVEIFETMNEKKWLLFKDGLIILMSIEILNNESLNTDYDAISLINRIPEDNNKQQYIANEFFQKLISLRLPVVRTNWIKLLSFVNDEQLNLNCLCLVATFDHFLYCLNRIVPLCTIDDKSKDKISTIFEDKLRHNDIITRKLKNDII